MATVDFTKPVTSDLRADVLAYIRDAINSQARLFVGDTLVSPPVGTVRYSSANKGFESWTGSAWGPLYIDYLHSSADSLATDSSILQYKNGNAWMHLRGTDVGYAIGGLYGADTYIGLYAYDPGAPGSPRAQIDLVGVTGSERIALTIIGAPALTADSARNISIGNFVPSVLHANYKGVEIGRGGNGLMVADNDAVTYLTANAYVGSGGAFKYGASDFASAFELANNTMAFYNGVSGTTGADITLIRRFKMDGVGNVAFGSFEPSAWDSSKAGLELGLAGTGLQASKTGAQLIGVANLVYDGAWKYGGANAVGWAFDIGSSDAFSIYRAPSGTAGAAATLTTLFTVNSDGMINSFGSGAGLYLRSRDLDGQAWLLYSPDGESLNVYHASYGSPHIFGKTSYTCSGTGIFIKSAGLTNYTDGCIEVRTGAGDAGIGFHNGGANASSLIYSRSSGYFMFLNNPTSSYQTIRAASLFYDGYLYALSGAVTTYGSTTVRGEKNGYAGVSFQRYDGTYMFTMMIGTDRAYWGLYDEARGVWPLYTSAFTSTTKTWNFEGSITASQNITAYSDARLKKNVRTLDKALDAIIKMRGVSFDRTDTDTHGVGVIAQEMQSVVPCLVHETDKGTLSVDYGSLGGYFIEAIKELTARVKYLEEQHG